MASAAEDLTWAQTPIDFKMPARACDCHVHVFGEPSLFPFASDRLYTPGLATVGDLERLLRGLQMERVVIVQASPYGSDNSCLLATLDQMGGRGRGVAVIDESVDEQALRELHRRGVRGARINLETFGSNDPEHAARVLENLAIRIAPLGWHIQTYTNLAMLQVLGDLIRNLPVDLVVDHFGRAYGSDGIHHVGFKNLLSLIDTGKVYVKLSASYRISEEQDYFDVRPLVQTLVRANPERTIWGSDWPHPSARPGIERTADVIEPFRREDDGAALNRLNRWVDDDTLIYRILVTNPEKLYGF